MNEIPQGAHAPSIEEMIAMQKAQALLEKAEHVLAQKQYVPMQTGYGPQGEMALFGIKYKLDLDTPANSTFSFAYATITEDTPEAEFHTYDLRVHHTGMSQNDLPLYTFELPKMDDTVQMGDFGFYVQMLNFVEGAMTQLGFLARAVRSGQAPVEALDSTSPVPEAPPTSNIILP